jgi:hypothetical protein
VVTDPPLRLVAHPLAIGANIGGEPPRPLPTRLLLRKPREDRRAPDKLRRDLDQRLADQHSDGVQIGGVSLETEPLCLERDRAAAGEGVQDRGRVAIGRGEDLLMGLP